LLCRDTFSASSFAAGFVFLSVLAREVGMAGLVVSVLALGVGMACFVVSVLAREVGMASFVASVLWRKVGKAGFVVSVLLELDVGMASFADLITLHGGESTSAA